MVVFIGVNHVHKGSHRNQIQSSNLSMENRFIKMFEVRKRREDGLKELIRNS